MECNRDEALRAKEIAERKFTAKDVLGAKKFALKAQNLFPALEGINQMISTLDVHLAAEVKINGENDWYAILCVNAFADDETVKKQYRKLALQLHPDKNKSIGAEGAFKLISEAWSVLSDRSRKMSYDQKRTVKGPQQKVSQPKSNHSVPNSSNGFYNFANNGTSNTRTQKSAAPPSSRPSKASTFWTSCNRCKMQYEYLRVYLNHNLLCPNCHEAFLAVETGFPANGASSSVPWSAPQQRQQNTSRNSTVKNAYGVGKNASSAGIGLAGYQHGTNLDPYDNSNFQWSAFSRTAGAASATASSSVAAQAASMVHQTYEKVRKEREEAQAAAKKEEALRRKNSASKRTFTGSGYYNAGVDSSVPPFDRPGKKRRSITEDYGAEYKRNGTEQMVAGTERTVNNYFGSNLSASETEMDNGILGDSSKARMIARMNNIRREFSQTSNRNVLILKAKAAIHKKLEEWNLAESTKLTEEKASQSQKQYDNTTENLTSTIDGVCMIQNKLPGSRSNNKQISGKKESADGSNTELKVSEHVTIDVPDPDFHDFDKDRTERSFGEEQVWASYDNEDGMPRFYILVQKVMSLRPFKLRISFLNSKSNIELGPMSWVASGFAKTCGDFRVGRYQYTDTINIFSHRVRWEKGARGVVRIVPRKGDTWAIYKNWSPDWNELTPDDVIYKYEMVEVVDDYSEEQGILVTPLVKVAGFKTVFHRHLDPKEVKRIPREEMFRFSHQVPSCLLTGEEAHNAPKGCRELDPAATPVELLQVITEFKEDEVMETEQQPVS